MNQVVPFSKNQKADLHCHSNCSDGEFSPHVLIERARQLGLSSLSITDHDSIAAYHQLRNVSLGELKLYSGVELSSSWSGLDIHIVGLGFDLSDKSLNQFLDQQKGRRESRAAMIAQKLEKKGASNVLEAALRKSGGQTLTRPHFAAVLIDQGLARNHKQAFDRFLGQGKPCYSKTDWPTVEETVSVIREAGGIAVLAHPGKYKMTATKLRRLVSHFSESSGQALEFVGGPASKDRQAFLVSLCEQHSLMASPASDFHSDSQPWQKLGQCGDIPGSLKPVWEVLGPLSNKF